MDIDVDVDASEEEAVLFENVIGYFDAIATVVVVYIFVVGFNSLGVSTTSKYSKPISKQSVFKVSWLNTS